MTALSRRTLLRSAGLALAPGLITACGGSPSSGNVANKGTKLAPWPTLVPRTGPAPDLKGDPRTGIQDTYLTYPSKLTKGHDGTPGDGSTLKVMSVTYNPPPLPEAGNKYWQAMEKALGVKIEFTAIPAADYSSKLATVMAGSDLPDVLNIAGVGSLPHEAEFVLKTMTDLSEHLSGDAVKDYPNLANIPTACWSAIGRFHGGIYGVPNPRARPGGPLWIDRDRFAKLGYKPTGTFSADEYAHFTQELTQGKHYGLGGLPTGGFASSFGIPNGWSVKNGEFTSAYEDPRYKDLLAYVHNLWSKKVMWPTSPTASTVDLKTQFYNGTIASYVDGFSALPSTLTDCAFLAAPALPLAVGGAKPVMYAGNYTFGYTVLNKNLAKSKVKMVLRLLDWLASPFGTEEYQLLNYGMEGVTFKFNGNGDPIVADLTTLNPPFGYMCNAPQVMYVAGKQDGVKAAYQWEQEVCPTMLDNPANGLRSATATSVGATITQNMTDTITGIVTGRQPVSSWDAAVKKWKSGGGDRIAKDYAEEHSANTTK
ncbi:hypothetical protein BIV57_12635 [Mangrovactinospora gilvigrisea]|uniref:ABC transporter substrate-binding protein n=1 Tax=Mangrovactinospora gilvigrisea TaxID=1428644 RepID=A0A1J7C6H8_9ACTN|nr:extracellular solute-binding protein [Mangrovactinospora gilvigrisea]OIV37168.1 hypothetical protein BIV57_12635 [Mangrovactinospora gilvigrisea]